MILRKYIILYSIIVIALSCGSPYGIYHRVHRGDTLGGIAETYGVTTEELAVINNLSDPDNIYPGQKIFVPGASRRLKVKASTQNKSKQKKSYTYSKQTPKKHENSFKPPVKGDFIWPVKGNISSKFGKRGGKIHDGIDIAAAEGSSIIAAKDGKVIYSDSGLRGYGNLIIIKHDNDYATVYAHNKSNLVKEGQSVKKGQKIGEVGKTGKATDVHLHFEIRKSNKPIDPLLYLK